MNRLSNERSPYLLQHANNPVEWFPWGDEAFEHARASDKPIFLSVGYSTCHWCHVMERESFENDEVAGVLNDHFVAIKVDREERPDVDRVYMAFVQATTGSGGWPMSVWLTPELKPFYGGTYFPPSSRWGRPGFVEILTEIARVWQAERGKVEASAEAMTARLRGIESAAVAASVPGADALDRTVRQFQQSFDARNGGFGDAPKFPRPSELLLLLREHARVGHSSGNDTALEMVLRTLGAMATGGMRDHIGGGFHRYSVDAAWRVPHFEKMLYDQAQLVIAYIEAAQASGDLFYLDVAEDTLRYVMREMTDADGGFYSAEDADSIPPEEVGKAGAHKAEGAFYLWRADEIDALAADDAAVVKLRFGIEPGGNAPADPQQEFTGKNLLYVARSIDDIAGQTGKSWMSTLEALGRARVAMFEHRLGRPRPQRDDKILTAWNGLMIAAFARMARVRRGLGDAGHEAAAPYLSAARRAASFMRDRMWNGDTRSLLRRYRGGHAEIEAYAEDYAGLVFGLLELFQADADPAWLDWAIALQRQQDELFWDEAGGAWFSTTGRDPSILLRMKEDYDGAEPSASSLSTMNLIVLAHLSADRVWSERIERTFRSFGERLERLGRGVPMMSAALSAHVAGIQQIIVSIGSAAGSGSEALERAVAGRYHPFAIALSVTSDGRRRLAGRLPFIAAMEPVDGETAVYVCRDFTCRQPATTVQALEGALAS
ncbi:MAG: thioredoxin domain-containing protein [Vicinamibacterales bacterium]